MATKTDILYSKLSALATLLKDSALKDKIFVIKLLGEAGLVDRDWYNAEYPDVAASEMDPLEHFVHYGFKELRCPCPQLKELYDDAEFRSTVSVDGMQQYLTKVINKLKIAQSVQKRIILRQGAWESLYDLPLSIDWMLTDMCNYKCSYCFGRTDIDKRKFPPLYKLINVVDNLYFLNRPQYNLGLIGGEPSAYPQILDLLYVIVSKFGKRLNNLYLVSNGSRDLDFFNNVYSIARANPISLIISIHTEYCNPEHIYKIVENYSDMILISFNLMFNPDKYDLVIDIYKNLLELRRKHYFKMDIFYLLAPPNFNTIVGKYTNEQKAWREHAQSEFNHMAAGSQILSPMPSLVEYEHFWDIWTPEGRKTSPMVNRGTFFKDGLFDFKGMFCCLAVNKIRVAQNGEMYGAICVQGKLPINLFEPNILKDAEFIHHTQCKQEHCSCNSNDSCMKFRDLWEADRYIAAVKKKQELLISQNKD